MRPDFEIASMSVNWNACHPSLLEELSGLSVLKQAPTFFAVICENEENCFFERKKVGDKITGRLKVFSSFSSYLTCNGCR